jgi:Spy/CpxP family protein refolding chaperone
MVNQSETRSGGEAAPPKARACPRWMTVVLFLSLVVNLFFGGLALGRIFHPPFIFGMFGGGGMMREFGPLAGHALQHLLGPLGRQDRDAAIAELRGHAPEFMSLGRAVREQRQAVLELMRADNFDRKAVDDAFAELRRRTDALQAAMESAVADAVQKLPPDARKQLGD